MKRMVRPLVLAVVMMVISALIAGTAIYLFTQAAVDESSKELMSFADRFAESIGHRQTNDTDVPLPAYLADSNRLTVVAWLPLNGGSRLQMRYYDFRTPLPTIPASKNWVMAPLQLALSGKTGSLTFKEKGGNRYLMVYRPIMSSRVLLVARDLGAILSGYHRASVALVLLALGLSFAGSVLFVAITRPLSRKVVESEEKYRRLNGELLAANRELSESKSRLKEMNLELESMVEMETIRNIVQGHKLDTHRAQLEISRDIQRSILPASVPKVNGLFLAARYVPMELVGGDFYDFHQEGNRKAGFLIADVSGHGIPAALIASMVKVAFSAQKEVISEPGKVLAGINNFMPGNWEDHFLTAEYVYVDMDRMTLFAASAAHTPLVIHRRSTGELLEFKPKGGIIGWFPNATFEQLEIPLKHGDRIILSTDGITEAMNQAQVQYGKSAFQELIRSAAMHTVDSFIDILLADVRRWTGKADQSDDLTLIVADVI